MNQYYEFWKSSINQQLSRDPIFLDVLSKLDKKFTDILEIGCARNINKESRYGDGWSSLFWADYILENGGSLTSCDIDQNAIDNVKTLLDGIPVNFNPVLADGSEILKTNNNYSLIYLDGSDDPQQMLTQLALCDNTKSWVFCDDFHTKGSLVSQQQNAYILYQLSNGHQMALFHESIKSKELINL